MASREKREEIKVTLFRNQALVLFELLSRFTEEGNLSVEDQAEARVLWDLLADLETVLDEPFRENYAELLSKARTKVRDTEPGDEP